MANRNRSTQSPLAAATLAWARRLRARGQLRAWSLLATVFGDIVAVHGGAAAPGALQAILGGLGVEPGALRTAMSRLARDGWIERRRSGRNVLVALSRRAAVESLAASRSIYALSAPSSPLSIVVAAPGSGRLAARRRATLRPWRCEIAPNVLMTDDDTAPGIPEGALIAAVEPRRLPSWALARLGIPELAEALRRLQREAGKLQMALAAGDDPAAALPARVLLIHEWRRLALRLPPLPAAAFPAGWPASGCAGAVAALYRQLEESSLQRLAAIAGLGELDRTAFDERWQPAGVDRTDAGTQL
jgi:phenylacetic acid degradation operon negative regulatory protein